MTIQQLQYVLEIARTGSVSRAARNLYLSQPNISNAVKNLEAELQIMIFERTPMGMRLTASGEKLVQKASSIIRNIQEITSTMEQIDRNSFRLVYSRYIPALEAFRDLCRRYEKEDHLHFACYTSQGEKDIEALYKNFCDLVIYINESGHTVDRLCADYHVKYEIIGTVKYHIQLSEQHPLLQKEHFELEELKQYPCVAFVNGWDDGKWLPWSRVANPDRMIFVESTSSRVALVASSQVFSIVLPHSEEYNRKHHVVQIPIEGDVFQLGYMYSIERGLSPIAEEYLKFLKKRTMFLS